MRHTIFALDNRRTAIHETHLMTVNKNSPANLLSTCAIYEIQALCGDFEIKRGYIDRLI